MIRALIVDDEPIARRGIRAYLKNEPDVEVAGECGSGHEAVAAIREIAPDLVFLDVQMPELDGFGVVSAVGPEHMPVVIFVTAYDQYALRAFDVHALDYVLKPVDRERFREAVARARARLEAPRSGEIGDQLLALLRDAAAPAVQRGYLKRLTIKQSERVYFLLVEDVDWIESAGNYVTLHAQGRTHMLRETMSGMEERLDPEAFVRIRRSIIVRIDRIKELHPLFNGEWAVTLKDGTQLTSSRRYRHAIDVLMGHNQ